MKDSNITIISCNYHSKRFAELLIKSVKVFSDKSHKIIIMDNSNEQEIFTCEDYQVIKPEKNMGHGGGLDFLIDNYVNTEYTLVMDIDAHILRKEYDIEFLTILKNKPNIGLIAPYRGLYKPIHPGVMFFRTEDFKNKIPLKPFNINVDNYPPVQMDVGQLAPIALNQIYHKETLTLKYNNPIYQEVHGATWFLNGKETFYHFGYGTRLYGKIEFGGIKKKDLDDMQNKLFNQINF